MKYKYICNDCSHQFNLRSYNKNCDKCKSENIAKQGSNKKYFGKVILLISLLLVGYFLLNSSDTIEKDGDVKYVSIFHDIENSNSISFNLVTNKFDTVVFINNDHMFLNLSITNITGSVKYDFIDDKIYPCDAEGVRYIWVYDTTYMAGQNLISRSNYIGPEEFEEFEISDNAICKINFNITQVEEPNLDNNCHFFVYTDHPDNVLDSSQIDTIGFTYFTKGENKIEISITGWEGPYLKQNEFIWDTTIVYKDIYARDIDYPKEIVEYLHNETKFENCLIPKTIIKPIDDKSNEVEIAKPISTKCNTCGSNKINNYCKKCFENEVRREVEGVLNDPFSNSDIINKYSWKLDGKTITENAVMFLDMAVSGGKILIIQEVQVSKNGHRVNCIMLKTK
jgi:hypothetical protein